MVKLTVERNLLSKTELKAVKEELGKAEFKKGDIGVYEAELIVNNLLVKIETEDKVNYTVYEVIELTEKELAKLLTVEFNIIKKVKVSKCGNYKITEFENGELTVKVIK